METHRWSKRAVPVEVRMPLRVGVDLTPQRARGSKFRRTSAGRYLPIEVTADLVEQRIVEEFARLPPGGVVTGWSALRLLGANLLDGLGRDGHSRLPVRVNVGPHGSLRRHPGVNVSYERLYPWEVTCAYGVAVTRPERAVFDEVRAWTALSDQVIPADLACAAGLTTPERLRAYAAARRRTRHRGRALEALARSRERVRSPKEVEVRLLCEDRVGCDPLLVNVHVRTLDWLDLGEVDLLEPASGLVVEFDGADHRTARQQGRDVEKDFALTRAGLTVARVTSGHLRSVERLVARLREARTEALAAPPPRSWVVEPPSHSLEQSLTARECAAAGLPIAEPWLLPPASGW